MCHWMMLAMLMHSVLFTLPASEKAWEAVAVTQSGAPISSSSWNICSVWQPKSPTVPVPKSHQGRQLP